MLDIEVEIESLPREISTGIQQYQIIELGSPQRSGRREVLCGIHGNAATAQDPSANITCALVGIDEENFLFVENQATAKWWWLVHTALPKPSASLGGLGGFSSREGGKSREMEKPRWARRQAVR